VNTPTHSIVLEHLSKAFRAPGGQQVSALTDVSLAANPGELLVLVGPSGSGKTTLLRLVAGLEEPSAGTISLGGRVVNTLPPKEREVAMVFQSPALYPHLSVRENLAFGLKIRRCPASEIQHRVAEAAVMLGLSDCLDRHPAALSGGQRQRVALGRALVRHPQVFLLDEPLSSLDAPMRAQMRAELLRLHDRLGATMLYVTHDQAEAMTLADRVAVFKEGALQQLADPTTLYEFPANQFVAGFIGSPPMNFFQGSLASGADGLWFQGNAGPAGDPVRLRVDDAMAGGLKAWSGKPVVLGLRPEHLSLTPSPPGNQALQGLVQRLESLGAEKYVHLASGKTGFIARVAGAERPAQGATLRVFPNMRTARFFEPESGAAIPRS
jgi:multiple sugar transport system ATP-binding protein